MINQLTNPVINPEIAKRSYTNGYRPKYRIDSQAWRKRVRYKYVGFCFENLHRNKSFTRTSEWSCGFNGVLYDVIFRRIDCLRIRNRRIIELDGGQPGKCIRARITRICLKLQRLSCND